MHVLNVVFSYFVSEYGVRVQLFYRFVDYYYPFTTAKNKIIVGKNSRKQIAALAGQGEAGNVFFLQMQRVIVNITVTLRLIKVQIAIL